MSGHPGPKPEPAQLVTIGPFAQYYAHAFVERLAAAGIRAVVVDEMTDSDAYLGGTGVKVMIDQKDAEQAAQVVRTFVMDTHALAPEGTPTVAPEVSTKLRGLVQCMAVGAIIGVAAQLLFRSPANMAFDVLASMILWAGGGAAVWFIAVSAAAWRRSP